MAIKDKSVKEAEVLKAQSDTASQPYVPESAKMDRRSNYVPVKRKRLFKLDLMDRKNLAGYVFVLPVIIGLLLVFVPSFVTSIRYSFSVVEFDSSTVQQTLRVADMNGWRNYHDALMVELNYKAELIKAIQDCLVNLPVIVLFSFFVAILLNKKHFPGRTIFRAILFLPVILFTGVALDQGFASEQARGITSDFSVTMFQNLSIAGSEYGMSGNIIAMLGRLFNLDNLLQSLEFSPELIRFIMMSVGRIGVIVSSSGVQILIFLAALQGIPASVFEAAQVEGLTTWELFWKITLPMVSPMILVNIFYTAVDAFGNSNTGILREINNFMYIKAIIGQASAMAILYFLSIALIIAILSFIVSRFVFYNT